MVVARSTQVLVASIASSSARHGLFQDGTYLRAQYELEQFIVFGQHKSDEHMYLSHLVLNPLFQRQAKFVLGDVMRQVRWRVWQVPRDALPPRCARRARTFGWCMPAPAQPSCPCRRSPPSWTR